MITPIVIAGYIAAGAASAFGSWLVNHFLTRRKLAELEQRVNLLEK